jgi:hypothetical protein
MKNYSLFIVFALFISEQSFAQSNCPDCVVNALTCPNLNGTDLGQICSDTLPDAAVMVAYDTSVTFRSNAQLVYRGNDTVPWFGNLTFNSLALFLPPGTTSITVEVDSFKIISVSGLPLGLNWACDSSANGCIYDPASAVSGCLKICGTTDCMALSGNHPVTLTIEYYVDLTDLFTSLFGGGPVPLPFPANQSEIESYVFNINVVSGINLLLDINSSTVNDTILEGESATIDATAGFSTYEWSNNATTASITVSPTQTSTYSVTATDANGCTQTASYILNVKEQEEPIDTNSGIASRNRKDLFRMYPNPSQSELFVEYISKENATLEIISLQGQLLLSEKFSNGHLHKKQIDLAPFSKGAYYIRLKSEKGTQTEKLFIH